MRKNCAFCGKPKKRPKAFNYVSRALWEADPYCARKCCEADHGITHKKGHTALDYGAEVTA